MITYKGKRYFSPEEAAKKIGVALQTFYQNYKYKYKLKPIKRKGSSRIFFWEDDLDDYLESVMPEIKGPDIEDSDQAA